MTGMTNLDQMLAQIVPELSQSEYVFASFPGARYGDLASLAPVACVQEKEGLTLVLERSVAETAGVSCDQLFRRISLNVHSSLVSVGLTAAVSAALADNGIPANMIAGAFHDHIYVPSGQASEAMEVLLSC